MFSWIITLVLAAIVAYIVFVERRCGRRHDNFLETITPEIDALNNSVLRKYRAKYGKDPTLQFPIVDLDGKS